MSQQTDALAVANEVRYGIAEIRKELRCGLITMEKALLDDERSQSMTLGALLCAQRYFGPRKMHLLLAGLNISPARRVRDLTDEQCFRLLEALER